MDELSNTALRGAATADNLRRAFACPPAEEAPAAFAALLRRIAEAEAARGDREPPAVRSGREAPFWGVPGARAVA
jgi:hypothetical protein